VTEQTKTNLPTRGQRLLFALRTLGLGVVLGAGGTILILQGGAIGIFFGIPLAAGGGLGIIAGLYQLFKYLLIPRRRFTCPRCGVGGEVLGEYPATTCASCGLPIIFLNADKLLHTTCKRCDASFGVGDAEETEVACPDCGWVHIIASGFVQEAGKRELEPSLEEFSPDGSFAGDKGLLTDSLRSDRGRIRFAGQIAKMLSERQLSLIWGELVARLRAGGQAMSLLARAAESGELTEAPDFWEELKSSTALTIFGWARYLELTGPRLLRPVELVVEFPLAGLLAHQHQLAKLPGFGEPWNDEVAELELITKTFSGTRYRLADFKTLKELALTLLPSLVDYGLDDEERERLETLFSVENLKASHRKVLAKYLGDEAASAKYFCDLTLNGNARAGLALLDDGGLASFDRARATFYTPAELKAVYFTEKELYIETTDGKKHQLPGGIPREHRAFLHLIDVG